MNYISGGTAGEYTVAFWFKADREETKTLFSDEQGDNDGVLMQLNALNYYQTYVNGEYYTSNFQAEIGTWYHIAQIQDGSNIKLYINGEFYENLTTNQNVETTTNTVIGANYNSISFAYENLFDGKIDELEIWNKALTETELQNYSCQILTGGESGLSGYYRMEDGSGTTATDATGTSNGTLTNMNNSAWVSSDIDNNNNSICWSDVTLQLTHADGDIFTLSNIQGNPKLAHLYRVDAAPNPTTAPNCMATVSDDRYWGVFTYGSSNVSHSDVYSNYLSNPDINAGNENQLTFTVRDNNADITWENDPNAVTNTGAETVTSSGNHSSIYENFNIEFGISFENILATPISGAKTIDAGGAGANNYTSFANAITALTTNGIDGPIVFTVTGVFNEQVTVPYICGVSDVNTITFISNTNNTTDRLEFSANVTDNFTLKFDEAEYVTFQNLGVKSLETTYGQVILIDNNSSNITLDGNKIEGIAATSNANTRVIYSEGENNDNITITNNEILGGHSGITIYGLSQTDLQQNLEISGNTIDDSYYYNIWLMYIDAPEVLSNTCDDARTSSIRFDYCDNNFKIQKNTITTINAPTNIIWAYRCDAKSSSPSEISNNYIQSRGNHGLNVEACTNTNIYYNNVNMTVYTSGAEGIFIVSCVAGANINIENNISVVDKSNGTPIYISTTTAINNMDYNILYNRESGNIGSWGGSCANIDTWREKSQKAKHSINCDPQYTSETDLHVNSAITINAGTQIVGITDDYDSDARDATPDIGADQRNTLPAAPLSGTYTIPGNYATFNLAVAAIQTNGTSGTVTFNVDNGTYTEQIDFSQVCGNYGVHNVVFQATNTGSPAVDLQFDATAASDNFVVKLDGNDNITFRQINMTALTTNTSYGTVVLLNGGAENCTFDRCNFTGITTTATTTDLSIVYDTEGSNGATFDNCVFTEGAFGVYYQGVSTTVFEEGPIEIRNSTFTNQEKAAIFMKGVVAPVFIGNTITTNSTIDDYRGFDLNHCSKDMLISKNSISTTTASGIGINLHCCYGTADAIAEISNNMVQIGKDAGSCAIYTYRSKYHNYYYNNLYSSSLATATNFQAPTGTGFTPTAVTTITTKGCAFFKYSNANGIGYTLHNNIFQSKAGYAVYFSSSESTIIDYNDLYREDAGTLGWWGSARADIDAWRAATGQSRNSKNCDPLFTSATDLHVSSTSVLDAGLLIQGITDDIDGEVRDATPDIGADQRNAAMPSPISGTKVIGVAPSDYTTFQAAVDDVKANGTTSLVTYNVKTAIYNEQVDMMPTCGQFSPSNMLFQAQSGTNTDVSLEFDADGVDNYTVGMSGNQNITFKNITLKSLGSTNGRVVSMKEGASNITFENSIIEGLTTTSTSAGRELVFSTDKNEHLKFINNQMNNGNTAIYIEGNTTTDLAKGILISETDFTDQYKYGVYIRKADAPVMEKGEYTTVSTYSLHNCIDLMFCDNATLISKNRFVSETASGCNIMAEFCEGTLGNEMLIVNNFMTIGNNARAIGIFLETGTDYVNCYYNNINLLTSDDRSRGIHTHTCHNINIVNNCYVTVKGEANYIRTPTTDIYMDYNIYFSQAMYMGSWGEEGNPANMATDLDEWQTLTGMEEHSHVCNPMYASDIDLHVNGAITFQNGLDLGGYWDDIDDEPRVSPPDIGADQRTGFTPGAALSGTYLIDQTGSGDYLSFMQAVDDVNLWGINGNVIFDVKEATYNEQIEFTKACGVEESENITFRALAANTNPVILNYAANADKNFTVSFGGANNISFEDLTIESLDDTYGRVFDIGNFSEDITLDGNIINGRSTTSTSSNLAIIYSDSECDNNMHITNNTFNNGSYAILNSGSTDLDETGTIISGNIFTDQRTRAIELDYMTTPQILSNTITTSAASASFRGIDLNVIDAPQILSNSITNNSTGTGFYGMYLTNCENKLEVKKNKIIASSANGYGIYFDNCTGTSSERGEIYNNYISFGTTSDIQGFSLRNSPYQNIYHNSINLTTTNANAECFYADADSDNLNIKNNVFATKNAYPLRFSSSCTGIDCDYNDLYTEGDYIGMWGSTNYSTLTDWQANGQSFDANSTDCNPHFVSDIDFHTQYGTTMDAGTDLTAFVTDDIDGDARTLGTAPDLGADERSPATFVPLSGTKTIGGGTPDYTTFNDAVTAIERYGVGAGGVTFDVRDGIYDEQVEINPVCGIEPTNPIIFQSENHDNSLVTLEFDATVSTENYTLKINAVDNVTFREMEIKSKDDVTYCRVIEFTNSAKYLTFENNLITGIESNSTSADRILVYSIKGKSNNVTFNNNTFTGGSEAIRFDCSLGRVENTVISNNTFTNQYYRTIYLLEHDAPQIISNNITSNTAYTVFCGMYLTNCENKMQVKKNKVIASNADGYGFYFNNCTGTSSERGEIYNNFISIGKTRQYAGLYLQNSVYQNVYNNSVNLTTTKSTAKSFYANSGSDNLNIKNNIFSIKNGYTLSFSSGCTGIDCNYNDLYTSGTNIGRWGSTDYTTIATWNTATGWDANSIKVAPNFTSATDLHIEPAQGALAIGLPLVTDDIDGESRPASDLYLGADEIISYIKWTSNVGANKTDWDNTANWDGGVVPTSTDNALIPTTPEYAVQFPELDYLTPSEVQDLNIETGAHVWIPAESQLTIKGNLINDGELKLLSTNNLEPTGSLITEGTVFGTGDFVAERYFSAGNWHYFASPVQTNASTSSYSRLYQWNESIADSWTGNDFVNDIMGWTGASTNFIVGKGYSGQSTSAEIKTFEGTFNTGDQNINLIYTDNTATHGDNKFDGWNLIGNPFPSALDCDAITTTDVTNSAIYYYDDAGDGNYNNYRYYISGLPGSPYPSVAANSGSRYIPAMQGFFVKANAGGGTLNFENAARTHSTQDFYKDVEHPNLIRLSLENGSISDETVIRFIPDATINFDGRFDAYKMYSFSDEVPQLYSIIDYNSTQLAINTLPKIANETEVPLGIYTLNSGDYTINASELIFEDNVTIYLEDAYENVLNDLRKYPIYNFTSNEEQSNDRFKLIFFVGEVSGTDNQNENIANIYSNRNNVYILLEDKNTNADIEIFNVLGQKIHQSNINSNNTRIQLNVATGNYIVKLKHEGEVIVEKVFINH